MKKIAWVLFAFLSISIGLYPISYLISEAEIGILSSKPDALLSNMFWKVGFYTHITLGGFALLIGWAQFNKRLQKRRPEVHRVIGKLYVISVMLSGVAGFYIAFFATGGFISKSGFSILAIIWLTTTFMGFVAARNLKFVWHEKLMIFSYAACFAAVTLRLWLPLLILIFKDFIIAYNIVAWLCWVPNLFVAYLMTKKRTVVEGI